MRHIFLLLTHFAGFVAVQQIFLLPIPFWPPQGRFKEGALSEISTPEPKTSKAGRAERPKYHSSLYVVAVGSVIRHAWSTSHWNCIAANGSKMARSQPTTIVRQNRMVCILGLITVAKTATYVLGVNSETKWYFRHLSRLIHIINFEGNCDGLLIRHKSNLCKILLMVPFRSTPGGRYR